jgi:hypothetical protein
MQFGDAAKGTTFEAAPAGARQLSCVLLMI